MSLATSSSASNEVIHSYNTMTNCGADPVTFERPTRKTHRVVKRKTCFEILDEYTKCRIKLKKSKRKNINQDKNILKIFLHFMGFPELNELDRLGAEQIAHAYCYRPKNPKKYKEFKGLEGFDLIARNESLLKLETTLRYLRLRDISRKCLHSWLGLSHTAMLLTMFFTNYQLRKPIKKKSVSLSLKNTYKIFSQFPTMKSINTCIHTTTGFLCYYGIQGQGSMKYANYGLMMLLLPTVFIASSFVKPLIIRV
ncbi:hypothetical protein BJG01_09945 [Vibrio splendidus]|nr:hypothetical protein BJG01_09945 [Vibrio splendidus]